MEYELFDKWSPLIDRFKSHENIEMEIRFGRGSGRGGFDTNVGKATFDKVLKALEAYDGWESKKHAKYDVYYFENNLRLQIDEDSGDREAVEKRRVLVDDFELTGMPFDVRLGVSTEKPFEYDGEEAVEQKAKERWSFVRKNLSIDMSRIKGNPDDPDCDDDMSYQIEMEIIDPKKIDSKDTGFKLLYKVFDLMRCV